MKGKRYKIVILANSRKQGNRCIAGIDVETGKWYRPCYGNDIGIPSKVRQINGQEPKLLDIIEMPLAFDGPNRNYQPENHYLLDGQWRKVGKATINQLLQYCEKNKFILHNQDKTINAENLLKLSDQQKKSLCLIKAHVTFSTGSDIYGRKKVNASFTYGSYNYCLPVTDYDYWYQFKPYSTMESDCLLTISLGLPFEIDNCCYKLVAGVINIA